MVDRGRLRRRRDPVRLHVPAPGLPAQLLHARQRPGPRADGEDDERPQRQGGQLPAAEQRHRARGAVQPDRRPRAWRSPAPACSATTSRASNCSTNRASAKATSSSRSPTSARCRDSSSRRSTPSRASPARRSSSCCPAPQNQLFGESQGASSAAVLLSGTSSIDQASVKGHRAARRLERPRPAAEQGHGHRRQRPAALAPGIRRSPAAAGRVRPGGRAALRPERRPRASTRCSPRRSAWARHRCWCTRT
jgi:hypothetical protein